MNFSLKETERNAEMQRWKDLYPKLNVQETTINGLPALLMNYGHQIELSERKKWLSQVEEELHRFAEAGFAYKDSDLRWRHVVLREGEILLVDLESLEDISSLDESGRAGRVEEQIDRLAISLEERCELNPKMC